MRIRDLNDERPTSAIFRDSKLEPLKISVTPSIARDRVLLSPDELAPGTVCPPFLASNNRPRIKPLKLIANALYPLVQSQIQTQPIAIRAKRKTPRKERRAAFLGISSERDLESLQRMKMSAGTKT
jgi:hypothetical protein